MKVNLGKIKDFVEDCTLLILSYEDLLQHGLNDDEIDYLVNGDYLNYNYLSDYYFWKNEDRHD